MKRIMVVDDSRVLDLQVRRLLEDTGYEVAAYCPDGESAIVEYSEVHPDVVAMDIIMPGMDGLEAARAILEEYPEARVVMMSSLGYDDALSAARSIGARGFLSKPFSRESLLAELERALENAG